MTRKDKAEDLFRNGCNCCQAVVGAFSDLLPGLPRETLMKMALPFGAGIGRMRETCGAVSAMVLLTGLLHDGDPLAPHARTHAYAAVQQLAAAFKHHTGSIICRELLAGVPLTPGPAPEPRTAPYYAKRPCAELCGLAAQILEHHLASPPSPAP